VIINIYKTGLKREKSLFLSISFLLVIGGLLGYSAHGQSFPQKSTSREMNGNDSIVVVINGISVSVTEYQLYLNRNVAMTHNYFHKKYGSYDHEGFWEHSFDGENPLEYLKTVTLEQVVHVRSVQRYAMDIKLIPEFDFNDVIKWWKEDNRSRIEKHKKGEVIFGPVETSLGEYVDYLFSNLVIRLKEHLNSHEFRASESKLESYYQKIKGKYFNYTPSIKVEYLEFFIDSYRDRDSIQEKALSIREEIEAGASMRGFASGQKAVQYRQKSFSDTLEIIGEENQDHDIREFCLQLSIDESRIVFSEANSAIYLMYCIDRMPEQIHPFNKVKNDVIWYYQKEQYNKLIQSLERDVEIQKNPALYAAIQVG